VDIVLSFLENAPSNDQLSFSFLSHKVAMLFALANADRCSDLAALDLRHRSFQVDGVKFVIPGLTKTRRSGPPIEVFYPSFTVNSKLCPVQALREYERQSKDKRQSNKSQLFISVRKPHAPVKPCTIGKWLKAVMTDAGIDTNIFTAHSTRGASTSKAKALGVSSQDILKTANWSSESTFCRFYRRPIASSNYGQVVLGCRSPKHKTG
jgi:integrase